MNRLWDWLAGLITAHYRWILGAAIVATVGLAFGLPRIHFKTGQDTFLRSSSRVYQDNLRYQGTFGGDVDSQAWKRVSPNTYTST